MGKRILNVCACLLVLSLWGCGEDAGTDAGSATDSGSATDAGPPGVDSGTDAGGPPDSCEGDDPTMNVGCNGALRGAAQPDNSFGGRCTPDPDDAAGSCTDADAECYAFGRGPDFAETAVGICIRACTPNGRTYTSTADCPTGSRCFELDTDLGACFSDCDMDSDCSTGTCDEDQSCIGEDVGGMDGGVADGGASDAGASDAGASDAGVPADAG